MRNCWIKNRHRNGNFLTRCRVSESQTPEEHAMKMNLTIVTLKMPLSLSIFAGGLSLASASSFARNDATYASPNGKTHSRALPRILRQTYVLPRAKRLNTYGSETSTNQIRWVVNPSQIRIEISMGQTQTTHSSRTHLGLAARGLQSRNWVGAALQNSKFRPRLAIRLM